MVKFLLNSFKDENVIEDNEEDLVEDCETEETGDLYNRVV
jgi:hypothetical protein